MDIFEYLTAETTDIEEKLVELTNNYATWSREKVFDRVKLICDAITGHLKKQEHLLLKNLSPSASTTGILEECQKDRAGVEEEIGQLVMVHVDEPGYAEYLANLLKVIERHITFSKRLYQSLRGHADKVEMKDINSELNDMVLHTTDYNSIQPAT